MQDTNYLPSDLGRSQIFTVPGPVYNSTWATWRKPRGVHTISMFALSGGGGGGGGFTAAASSARGGGGGGGSGSVTVVEIDASMLPDVIYVLVGAGGLGANTGTAQGGLATYVAVYPDVTAAQNIIILASGPAGGTSGTGTAVGVGGSGGSATGLANMPIGGWGLWNSIAGQAGSNGGAVAGAVGVNTTLPTTGICTMGGAGGAGTTSANFAGGYVTAVANTLIGADTPAAPAAGSFNGSGGRILWPPAAPFFSFGGCGGSSNNSGVGGAGGNGAYGSGGGGGGGGTTGGRGGDGGNGLVIITCW